MIHYNLIVVFNPTREQLLFCRRRKAPYQGLLNLIGGKIELGEDGLAAAYRELWEETGIERAHIILTHAMDFIYHLEDCSLEVYVGRLNCDFAVHGDENELLWSDLDHNFFDSSKYAGNGNIGHILELIRPFEDRLLQ